MSRRRVPATSAGGALLIVLLTSGLLAAGLLTLLAYVTSHRRPAVRAGDAGEARMLVEAAANEAMARIVEAHELAAPSGATQRVGHVTACPGLLEVRRFDVPWHRGDERGAAAFGLPGPNAPFFRNPFAAEYGGRPANPRWIPLFSWRWFAPEARHLAISGGRPVDRNPDYNPAARFNLNTARNPFRPGEPYLSGPPADAVALRFEKDRVGRFARAGAEEAYRVGAGRASADLPVWVQWIPVLEFPDQPPGPDNRMVGRYAFWVDVENTKLRVGAPLRSLRGTELFALAHGESDAAAAGAGSWFTQDATGNRFAQARLRAEATTPFREQAALPVVSGLESTGLAAPTARHAFDLWLGWRNGERPFAADATLVDWDFFHALRPAEFQDVGFGDILARADGARFSSVAELASLLDPAIARGDPSFSRRLLGAWRRIVDPAVTLHGHEDECDPLGRPKLDLVKLQLEARAMAAGAKSADGLRQLAVWPRLVDPAYHGVYHPAASPNGGVARSFAQSWNAFAGDGDRDRDANGEAATLQMLANFAGAAFRPGDASLIDEDRGIVSARSMPYVAEVATRARSALWLLPSADRRNPDLLLARDAEGRLSYRHAGRPLSYYLRHAVVDLALAAVNPNPLETAEFDGEITLDATWHAAPDGVAPEGNLRAPLRGRFTVSPRPGKDAKSAVVAGDAVVIPLAVVPGWTLHDPSTATLFRLRGWEIRSSGQVWHRVPVKHPGTRSTREWWAMAQSGQNAGAPVKPDASDRPTEGDALQAYQHEAAQFGYRAVGWFTRAGWEALPGTLTGRARDGDRPDWKPIYADDALTGFDLDGPLTEAQVADLRAFIRAAEATALVERVRCLDPILGHRTGDPTLRGAHGDGHLEGALGHLWRRLPTPAFRHAPVRAGGIPPGSVPEIRPVAARRATYASGEQSVGVTTRAEHGVGFVERSVAGRVPTWRQSTLEVVEGGVWTGDFMLEAPNQTNRFNLDEEGLGLTALFEAPSIDQAFPLGPLVIPDPKGPDLEVTEERPERPKAIAKPDGPRGARSFFTLATRGAPMTSVGEIGFCPSGFPNRPIVTLGDEGAAPHELNAAANGPPMRMLLDLFTPGAFSDPTDGQEVGLAEWTSGAGPSHTPSNPRRGTWNVNTAPAHDGYMLLREGAPSGDQELKKEVDPVDLTAHVVWLPNAAGYARRDGGDESFIGDELEHLHDANKSPGHVLDRHAQPFPRLPRPWDAWLAVVGGDVSPGRSTGGTLWGFDNALSRHFGPGAFTWSAGRGVASGAPYHETTFGALDPADPAGARLLSFGGDGRKKDQKDNNKQSGWMRGRFAADQNLDLALTGQDGYLAPISDATRFSLFPLRHFTSDLAVEFNHAASFADAKTALNPRRSAAPAPTPGFSEAAKKQAAAFDGSGFPGGAHDRGVFRQAPLALLANQASMAANAFTIHIVAQVVRDTGESRPGVTNSGPGHSDFDDEVVVEEWARVVFEKTPPATDEDQSNRFRVVSWETRRQR